MIMFVFLMVMAGLPSQAARPLFKEVGQRIAVVFGSGHRYPVNLVAVEYLGHGGIAFLAASLKILAPAGKTGVNPGDLASFGVFQGQQSNIRD